MSNSELLEQNNQKLEELAENLSQKALSQVPAGGTTDQVLAKASDADYDTKWVDAPSGGGGSGQKLYRHGLRIDVQKYNETDGYFELRGYVDCNIITNSPDIMTSQTFCEYLETIKSLPSTGELTFATSRNPETEERYPVDSVFGDVVTSVGLRLSIYTLRLINGKFYMDYTEVLDGSRDLGYSIYFDDTVTEL